MDFLYIIITFCCVFETPWCGSTSLGNTDLNLYLDEQTFSNIFFARGKTSKREVTSPQREYLRECFNSLEQMLYDLRKNDFKPENMEVTQFDGTDENDLVSESLTEGPDLEVRIENVRETTENLFLLLESRNETQDRNLTLTKPIEFKGQIKVEKIIGQVIELKEINSKLWAPERWLRYEAPQTVTGPVRITSIVTEELETSPEDLTFKNLLLKNEDLFFSGKITAKSLTAKNIDVDTVNNIPVDGIYLKSEPELINGLKTFRKLHANEAKIGILNEKNVAGESDNPSENNFNLADNVSIEHLEIETVDGVLWNDFRDSVFRASETDEIIGNLKIPTIKTLSINLKTLNGIKVEDLLTTSTDQTIHANITFKRIFAENINSNWTNGIKLKESVALMDQDTPIKGPITLEKMSITKNLNMIGKVDKSFLLRNGGRIIGTNESDLLQQYETVKIKGNLYLKNLDIKKNASLFVAGETVPYNFNDVYWTKSTNQNIPVRVHFQDSITVPHLTANSLNDIKIGQFMRNNNDQQFETDYIFENVAVFGNVILNNDAEHKPDLNKLNEDAVKTKGSFFISGKKTYEDSLRCEDLVANELDGIKTLDTLKKNVPTNITGNLIFKNVVIQGNVSSTLNRLDRINGVDVPEFLEKVILLEEPQELGILHFKHLKADNIEVTTFNDQPIEEYIARQKNLRNIKKIENLIIDGNLTIIKVNNVSGINDVSFEDLIGKAKQHGTSGGIPYDLRFTGSIELDNLATFVINDINLFNLTSRLLFREMNQNITAPFSFQRIKAENIVTPKINNVSMENLIDVSREDSQTIYAGKGITFSDTTILKSLKAGAVFPCRLEDVIENINRPSTRKWKTMEIHGNVSVLDEESTLYRIFEKTVKANEEIEILAPVTFDENLILKNIQTMKNVNNVNISHVFEDVLLKDSPTEQIITGRKWYKTLEVSNAIVLKNADIAVVNNETVTAFNDDIVDKNILNSTIIKGMKTFFGGLQADNFFTSSVMGVKPENIVTLPSTRMVPEAIFDNLIVENDFNITFVNNQNLSHILEDRLLLKGPSTQICNGIYFFDNLEIKNASTPLINKIRISNLVFDDGTIQNISSPKHFMNDLEIYGNVKVDFINGLNLTKEFANVVQNNDIETTINGSITLLRPSLVKGKISTESINGVPIKYLEQILNVTNTKEAEEDTSALKEVLLKKIGTDWHMVQSPVKDYMYLEESNDLQLPVTNAITATTLTSRDYVHIYMTGEDSGEHCGLPSTCSCPFQNTLIISPEMSVSRLSEKGSQRIFSYDDQLMTVHFITNSVSMSPNCRTDAMVILNEVSMMSWITAPTNNSTGKFHQYKDYITGFIQKVEFFTFKDHTYVIVGRYYDPVIDSYDLNCTIIKFNEDRSSAEVIDEIPTRGLREVYMFYTAQGIRLIIGNVKKGEEETQIYTFNPDTEKFDLMRTIPNFGCSSAVGIILETDSLIALKHEIAPVQILKYYPEFNNYYHFQSFDVDEPVEGLSVFYSGDFGISDAYLCLVTSFEKYFIYSYRHMTGFKLVSKGLLEGLKNMVPVEIGGQNYILALSAKSNSLLKIVRNGSS